MYSLHPKKKNIIAYIEQKIIPHKNFILGGSYNVQIDKTAIYKGKMITNPINTWDKTAVCTCLVGLITLHSR